MDSTEVVPVKQSAGDALIAMIATAAQTSSIEIDKLKELMIMRKEILAHEAEIAFNVAMNEAQGEMSPIVKDAKNPHAGNRYATLEQVDREIRPIYAKHGFCLTFNTATPMNPQAIHVTCEVRHSGGHKKEYFLEGDLDVSGSQGKSNKTSIQGLGSSVSYLRRYLTLMIFNLTLTNEDNDGNGNRGDKPAYDAMRHAADARQAERQAHDIGSTVTYQRAADKAARDAAAKVVAMEPQPGLEPQHAEQLAESVAMANKAKLEEMFKPIYDRYDAIGKYKRYHAQIKSFGVKVFSDFDLTTPAGKALADRCVSTLLRDVYEQEEDLKRKATDSDVPY